MIIWWILIFHSALKYFEQNNPHFYLMVDATSIRQVPVCPNRKQQHNQSNIQLKKVFYIDWKELQIAGIIYSLISHNLESQKLCFNT